MLTNSKSKLDKSIPNTSITQEDLYAHAWYDNYKKKEAFIVILNFHDKCSITNGVIAHEALHIAGFIGSARGIKADFNNDEPMTYLTEWVVDQVHKFVKQKKFKIVTK